MCVDEKTTRCTTGSSTATRRARGTFQDPSDGGLPGAAIPGTHRWSTSPGAQHLTAYEALDYVRSRDLLPSDGDYDRQRHQQQFIKALMQEGLEQGHVQPDHAEHVPDQGQQGVRLRRPWFLATDWIFAMKGITPDNIISIKTNNGTYNTVHINGESREELSPDSLQLLADVRDDTVDHFISAHPTWVNNS